MKAYSEKSIETQIISYLRYNGAWVQKIQSGAITKGYQRADGSTQLYKITLAQEGCPDIFSIIKGKPVLIEVKKDRKELESWRQSKDRRSIAQHLQQENIRQAGGITLTVCSVEELCVDLQKLGLIDNAAASLQL